MNRETYEEYQARNGVTEEGEYFPYLYPHIKNASTDTDQVLAWMDKREKTEQEAAEAIAKIARQMAATKARVCIIDGCCGRGAGVHGLCSKHYTHTKRWGHHTIQDITKRDIIKAADEARILEKYKDEPKFISSDDK